MGEKTRHNRGFTLLEATTAVAVIGILAAAAMQFFANGSASLVDSQLEKNVRTLNQAVAIYKTFGGSMAGADTPQEVLRRLQTRADATSREQVAGITGNLIDRRMVVRLLPESAAASGRARALWDSTQQRFVVTTGEHDPEQVAVASFEVDWSPEKVFVPVNGSVLAEGSDGSAGEDDAAATAGEEYRDPELKLALGNGWIWDYNESSAAASSGPTAIPTPGAPGGAGGFGAIVDPGEGGGGGSGSGGASAQPLDPPVYSIPSGAYLITSYALELTLQNPNAGEVSRIIYQVSGGPWAVYGGESITVAPNTTVTAFTESVVPGSWSNSEVIGQFYGVINVQLEEPTIETSDDDFGEIEVVNGN